MNAIECAEIRASVRAACKRDLFKLASSIVDDEMLTVVGDQEESSYW